MPTELPSVSESLGASFRAFLPKLFSDRLLVALAFVLLVVVDAWWQLGISTEHMTEAMYVVISFILGKTLRGTGLGSLLEQVISRRQEIADRVREGPDPPE